MVAIPQTKRLASVAYEAMLATAGVHGADGVD